MHPLQFLAKGAAMSVLAAFAVLSLIGTHPSSQAQGTPFSQKLVLSTHARHREATEIGIAVRTARGCRTIASTDRGDVGEKCEKEDFFPMQTGKPFVQKERDGFDISLPLHDRTGKLVGSVGIELKPEPAQTRASALAQARKIADEMEKQIPSKAKLLEGSR